MAQPIKVHLTPPGPNPWKVVLVLQELGVPYEYHSFPFAEVKNKPYTDINPNGRVPAIEDPNTGVKIWETGAIILYLIEQYDTDHKISFPDLTNRSLCNQFLFFQVSGQGPYFGQAGWFNVLHSEKLQSAMDRYNAEVQRILGVLEGLLSGKQWLVGDKMTYADLSFVTWNDRIDSLTMCAPDKKFVGFPGVQAWHERMTGRDAWKKCMEDRDRLMDEQGLQSNGMPKGVNSMEEYEALIKAHNEAEAAKKAGK
ncbi:glutathione S-transferase [Polyplosphaeria fusca]|uniref:glutathione transferase n=1 Tax=Polyplosphaeria fusca TaxID=682080 RepID=A0A9P4UTQ2_9PLEO|nr:glutathione S-transferase [Polyplosphaeria fusca]